MSSVSSPASVAPPQPAPITSTAATSGLGVDTVVNYESCLEFLDDTGRLPLPLIPPAFAEAFMLSHLGCTNENIKDGILDDDGEDFSSMDVENDNWDQCFTGIEDILSKDIDIESLDIFNGKVDSGLDKVDPGCVKIEAGEEDVIEDSGLDSEGASNDASSSSQDTQVDTSTAALAANCLGITHNFTIKDDPEVKDIVKVESEVVDKAAGKLPLQAVISPAVISPVAQNMDNIVIKTEKVELEPVVAPATGVKRPLSREGQPVIKAEQSLAKKLALSCTCAKCTKSGSNKPARLPTSTSSQVLYISNSKAAPLPPARAISCGEVNPTVQALLSAAAAANAMLSKQKQQQGKQGSSPVVLQQAKQGTSSMVLLPPAKSRNTSTVSKAAAAKSATSNKASRSRQPPPPPTEKDPAPAVVSPESPAESSSTTSSSSSSAPTDLTCVACTKTFSRRYNLRRHQMSLGHWAPISHPNPITFKSTRLEQSMPAEQAAPRREEIHDDEKPFLCTACSMRFTLKSSLRRHQIKFNHVNQVKQEETASSPPSSVVTTTVSAGSSAPASPAHTATPPPPVLSSSPATPASSSTAAAPVFTLATISPPATSTSPTLGTLCAKVTTPAPISATIPPPPLSLSQPSVRPNPDLVAIATPSPITVAKASPSLATQLHNRLAVAAAASSGTPFTLSTSPSAISALTIATPPPMMTTTLTPPSTPPQPVQPSASPQPPSTISLMIIPYLKMKATDTSVAK